MTSTVAFHLRHWKVYMIKRHQVWHVIIALGQQTRLEHVRRGMPPWPLGDAYGRTKLGVACYQRRRVEQTVWQCSAWHVIISLGYHIRSDYVGRGMQSLPLGKTHGQTTSSVAGNHIPWTTHTVEKRRAFHAFFVFGLHTQSDDVRHGMPACPLGRKYCKTTSGKAFHHRPWTIYKVRRRRAWHVIIDLGQ